MIVVVDASVLVAELLRRRGRELLRHPELSVVVAEDQWQEVALFLDAVFGPVRPDGPKEGVLVAWGRTANACCCR
jgi:hypothetical protein